jgi:hypothetical protein
METFGNKLQSSPNDEPAPMKLRPCNTLRAPMRTPSPTMQCGPMWALGSICALLATTADGWMPAGNFGSGKNNGSTRANASRASGTRMTTLTDELNAAGAMMAEAALCSARAK